MDEPPGLTRYLPWAAGIAILFVFGIAWAFGLGDWGALQTMLAAPPGELSSVARTADGGAPLGARVYHGKLFGPAGRVAPNGRPAAIYRAWVEPTDEDADGEYCVTAAHDGVWLEGDAGVFPLGWLEGNRDVPLFLADGVVGPSSDATVIEAPGFGKEGVAGFPAPLDACAGSSRASHMSIVPRAWRWTSSRARATGRSSRVRGRSRTSSPWAGSTRTGGGGRTASRTASGWRARCRSRSPRWWPSP